MEEYLIGIGLGVADMLAYALAGVIYEKLGVKKSLIGSYGLSTLFGIIILTFGLKHERGWSFVIFTALARFGISFAFCIVYVAHPTLFPVLFSATAFGICNFFSRLSSSLSSLFANM